MVEKLATDSRRDKLPFGLAMATQRVPSSKRAEVEWSAAKIDPTTQLAMVGETPAWKVSCETKRSSSTERDGRDPISVDTDPYYDYCGYRL